MIVLVYYSEPTTSTYCEFKSENEYIRTHIDYIGRK